MVVADINTAASDDLVRSLGEQGHDAIALNVDVSDVQQADAMAKDTADRFGRIDALINNAAVFQRPAMTRGPFDQVSVEEWDRLMAVNLRGTFLCARAVVPYMKQQGGGSIINISSGTVHFGAPMVAHYVASKAGVIGFTRALSKELGEFHINVNAVAPGLTISLDDPGGRPLGGRQAASASPEHQAHPIAPRFGWRSHLPLLPRKRLHHRPDAGSGWRGYDAVGSMSCIRKVRARLGGLRTRRWSVGSTIRSKISSAVALQRYTSSGPKFIGQTNTAHRGLRMLGVAFTSTKSPPFRFPTPMVTSKLPKVSARQSPETLA